MNLLVGRENDVGGNFVGESVNKGGCRGRIVVGRRPVVLHPRLRLTDGNGRELSAKTSRMVHASQSSQCRELAVRACRASACAPVSLIDEVG